MKRFILIALACILPNLNGAFAVANLSELIKAVDQNNYTKVQSILNTEGGKKLVCSTPIYGARSKDIPAPYSLLELAIDNCCGFTYDRNDVDMSKKLWWDYNRKKYITDAQLQQDIKNGIVSKKHDFNEAYEVGFVRNPYNNAPKIVQALIDAGADVHVTSNLWDYNKYKGTGTLSEYVKSLINGKDACKETVMNTDDKDTEHRIFLRTWTTPEYCQEILQILTSAQNKISRCNTNSTTPASEAKPAEPIVQKTEVQPTPPAPEAKTESSGTATKPGTDPKKPGSGNDEEFPPIDITQDDACDPNDLPRHAVSGHMQDGKCIVDSCEDKYKVVNNKCEEICSRTAKKAIKHASAYTEYNNDICIPSACEKGYKLEGEKTQNAKCVEVCDAISIAALKTHHATDWKSEGQTCIPTKCEKGFGDSKNNPVNKTCPEQQKSTTTPAPTQAACTTEELAELHATAAVRMVDDGKCAPIKCDTDNGYMLEANKCVKTQNEPAPVGSETPKPTDGTDQNGKKTETKTEDKKPDVPGNSGATTGTITYELNDGTLCSNAPTTYTIGQDKDFECKPTKQYYNFGGWFRDANFTRSAAKRDIRDRDMPTTIQIRTTDSGNLTFYAKWNRQTAIVKYDCGDFKNCGCDKQDFWVGESGITLCTPNDRPGFEFEGWKHDGEIITAETFELKAGSTTTLHAVWKQLPKTDEINVSGRVTDDETGDPMQFLNILVFDANDQAIKNSKGKSLHTQTDSNGYFTIEGAPNNARIVIKMVGYETLTLSPQKQEMDIKLKKASTYLSEYIEEKSATCTDEENHARHIKKSHKRLKTYAIQERNRLIELRQSAADKGNQELAESLEQQVIELFTNPDNYICDAIECEEGYGDENNIPTENPETHDLECVQQKPIVITPPPANYGAKCGPTGICPQPRESKVFAELEQQLNRHFSDSSVWKNDEGKFNTARLASDSIAATVLGTVGGVVTSVVMKKSQTKKGFEDMRCTVAGQNVASYGDEFKVGLFAQP